MSLKRNIVANYVSQFYVALVGIALVPLYLRVMGAEAYGLVAFFALLQSWFQLLDMGLTATMSREAARYRSGSFTSSDLRQLLRSMEAIFWAFGLVCAVALAAAAPAIATRWLNSDSIASADVELSVAIMAMTVALRWISGLYKGLIVGLERQVWAGIFNVIVVTIRFVGVVPVLLVIDSGPVTFFVFQAIVSLAEMLVLLVSCYSLVPVSAGTRLRWSIGPLKSVFRFSATVAFTSSVWVLVTQTDKLLISRLVTLEDYGFFAAAVLMASGITLISGPVAMALLPRLTSLNEQNKHAAVVALYRKTTQAVAAVAGSAALILTVFAERVLWIWTGDPDVAATYAPVLALYSIGNGFLALGAFPYYLQYAKGDLALHFRGNVFFVLILIPAIVLATTRFGVVGAGIVWAATNAAFFLLWTPFIHHRFLPGLHWQWVREDVLKVLAIPMAIGLVLLFTKGLPMERFVWAVYVFGAACCVVTVALCRCDLLRPHLESLVARVTLIWR